MKRKEPKAMYKRMKELLDQAVTNQSVMDVQTKLITTNHITNFSVRGLMTGEEARELLELLEYC